ncbi:MAG: gluconokinase [Bacteroidota bacterium]|nr:gluconokinase [Bacteroidota bacterium]
MDYFLGVDMGTTSIKAVAFSPDATLLRRYAIDNKIIYTGKDYSEQEPHAILKAVIQCITEVKALLQQPPLCISFSAALHGIIAIDALGEPLTNCILWNDTRAAEEAAALHKSDMAQQLYSKTGVPVHAMTPLCKILWLQKNRPDIFQQTKKFIGLKEYVLHAFTGRYLVDTSLATATGLCNIYSLQWDESILKVVNISCSQLSEIVPTNTIVYDKNGCLPSWAKSIPLIIGAGDGPLANLGMGILNDDKIAVTIGTSAAARRTVMSPQLDDKMQTFCYHLENNKYTVGGASNNGANVLQWLKNQILQSNQSYTELIADSIHIKAGSEGLIVLPYLSGDRAPLWNANATAAFLGFTHHHTHAHCVKAVMEGVLMNVYSIITALLTPNSHITSIYAGGGFARSAAWVQMLADITGFLVYVPATVESSALGAAIMGAQAVGENINIGLENQATVYYPNQNTHAFYYEVWLQYQAVLVQLGLLKSR